MGQEAVAHVLINRVKHPDYPGKVCANTYKKSQFSWVGTVSKIRDRSSWEEAKDTAYRVLSGNSILQNFKATHFYNPKKASPSWAKKCRLVKKIGNHHFHEC